MTDEDPHIPADGIRDLATEYRQWVKLFGEEKADDIARQAVEIETLNALWKLDEPADET